MASQPGSKQAAEPTRTVSSALPPLHAAKSIEGVWLPTAEELWQALEAGTSTEAIEQALKSHDVRKMLLRTRVPLKQLRRLFSLRLSQQTRLMLMSLLKDMLWFQELPQADQDSIRLSYQGWTAEKAAEKPTPDRPNLEKSATKVSKVTPVPIPTPGSTPSQKAVRVFMAKRTGRTTLSPSIRSDPSSPRTTATEGVRQPEAAPVMKRAQVINSSDSSSAPDTNKRQKLSEPASINLDTESEWESASTSETNADSLKTSDLVNKEHGTSESEDSDEEEEDRESNPEPVVSDIPSVSEDGMDIPDAMLTAPSGRRYNKWVDNHGALVTTNGALIPDSYKLHDSGSDLFPCPVRSCLLSFPLMSGLGHHFSAVHNSNLLNDNLDGTLSLVRVAKTQGRLGARVISQKVSAPDTAACLDTTSPAAHGKRAHKSKEGHKSTALATTPSGRKYAALPVALQSKDKRDSCFGVLLPDGYQKCDYPGNPWICPVRNCRRVFPQLLNLGSHFTRQHRHRQLNDNGDGTLSEIGRHQDSHAIVVSQIRRAASELEPMAKPEPPGRIQAVGNGRVADPDQSRSSNEGREQQPRKSSLAEATFSSTDTSATWEYVKPLLVRFKNGGIPQTGYASLFAPLQRVRNIRWNDPWIKNHPFLDTLPRDVSSLIMQVTGEQSILPCQACRNGRGPYHGCVILPPHAPMELHATILCCANCLYHCNQAYCTLRDPLHDRFSELFPEADMNAERLRMNVPRYEPRKSENGDGGERDGLQSRGSATNASGSSTVDRSVVMGRRSERIAVRESLADTPVPPIHDVRRTASADPAVPAAPAVLNKITPIAPPVLPGLQSFSFRSTSTATPTTPAVRYPANPVAPGGATEPVLSDLLEMEDWEVAPGRLQVERAARPGGAVRTENMAFSNAFLTTTGQQMVRVDHNISFRVDVVRPGATHVFDADPRATHVCSLASGKLRVRIDDAEFVLGPHGMFQVRPGQRYTVRNYLYVDAYLHVSAVRDLP